MYSLTDDFVVPTGIYGGAIDDDTNQLAFAQFMSLLRPWIIQSGSALDVEELLAYMLLPTTAEAWMELDSVEVESCLGVAKFFNAMAHAAFDKWNPTVSGAGTYAGELVECNTIGPALLGGAPSSVSAAQVPLQIGLDLGAEAATGVVGFVIAGATASDATYAALDGGYSVTDQNTTLATADIPAVIEVGIHRMVIRREFFNAILPAKVSDDASKGVPHITGMTISPAGISITLTGVTLAAPGVVSPFGSTITFSGGATVDVVAFHSLDETAGTVTLVANNLVGGPPAAAETLTSDSSGAITALTIGTFTDAGVTETPVAIRNFDFLDVVNGPSVGSQWPNYPATGSVVGHECPHQTTLLDEIDATFAWIGATDGATTRSVPGIRSQYLGKVAFGLAISSAFIELTGRFNDAATDPIITGVTTTLDPITAALQARGLPTSARQVLGYSASGAVASTPSTGAHADGGGTAGSLTPVGELGRKTVAASEAYIRMWKPAETDNLLDTVAGLATPDDAQFAVPHIRNLLEPRAEFVAQVQAWMHQIRMTNTDDAVLNPNTFAMLSTHFGWDAAVVGTAVANAASLHLVDPTLHGIYMTQALMVASGHPYDWRFYSLSETFGSLTKNSVYMDGTVTSDFASGYGNQTQVFNLKLRSADVKTGTIRLNVPRGVSITAASYVTVPGVTANISSVGTGITDVTFTFADAGALAVDTNGDVDLATFTITSTGPTEGSPTQQPFMTPVVEALTNSADESVRLLFAPRPRQVFVTLQ